MPWVKLDAAFPTNPKVLDLVAAGEDKTILIYLFALCSSQLHLTDGFVSLQVLRSYGLTSRPTVYANKLVSVGLWEVAPGRDGWIIHDYHLHQRTKDDVEKIREDTRNRVQRHRSNVVTQKSVTRNVTLPDTDTDTDTEVTLAPTTSTGRKKSSQSPSKPRPRDLLFETTAEAVGLDWHKLTASERGRLNAAVGELREIEATPDDVKRRAARYREMYPGMPLTATALSSNWSSLTPQEEHKEFYHGAPSLRDMPGWDEDEFYGPHGPPLIDFAS